MAFGATIPIILLQRLLLFIIIFNPSSASADDVGVPDETLRSICKKTMDYYFCRMTFRSWDGIEHADLNELANVAILSAKIQARLNKHLVKAFLDYKKYPEVKSQLEDCYVDYNVTLGKLESAYIYSDRKDYARTKKFVDDALTMSVKCEITFTTVEDKPNPIEMYSIELERRNNIALIVVNELI
ncbi:hypothetical protein LguiB_029199 [Lonicera macranthoides]